LAVTQPLLAVRKSWRFVPSVFDWAVFALVIGALVLIAVGGRETLQPITAATRTPIDLSPLALPNYALRTTLRMLAAMACSVLFTFLYGTLAAKSRRAEVVLVPLLDILQSLPILTFLSFTLTFFLTLFPGQLIGAELAAIFMIFTSQAWNMTFSFYQSLKTVPRDLSDVSSSLRLGPWRRFWVLEAPYAAPGLIWNAMMSMSGAWFFVVASEMFSVGQVSITLPGVGSYVATAIARQDLGAIGWAILTMALVILAYDQLLFRPLVAWSQKFTVELAPAQGPPPESWLLNFFQRAQLARRVWMPMADVMGALTRVHVGGGQAPPPRLARAAAQAWKSRNAYLGFYAAMTLFAAWVAWRVIAYIGGEVSLMEALAVVGLGVLTLIRVLVLIALSSLIWVPLGVMIGLRRELAAKVQPIVQFLAAFPSNLLFPLVVVAIVRLHGSPDVWLSPLMILGAQWYILFNVIAGAQAFPSDLQEAARSFGLRGFSWWRKVILPGVFPYYVTGAITASGGAWNASILAEVASWGNTQLTAKGLGSFIAEATTRGDFPRVTLGAAVMSVFVVGFNRALWRPLFDYASKRLRMD
jgi:NitT/TauT family transport system permease protein